MISSFRVKTCLHLTATASRAIYLHHIPDLQEDFIYLNDDTYITKPLATETFFQPNVLPNGQQVTSLVLRGWEVKTKTKKTSSTGASHSTGGSHGTAVANLHALLTFIDLKHIQPLHQACPMKKSIMMVAEITCSSYFQSSRSQFRSRLNIPPVYLAFSFALALGQGRLDKSGDLPSICVHGYQKFKKQRKEIEETKPALLCVNSLDTECAVQDVVGFVRKLCLAKGVRMRGSITTP